MASQSDTFLLNEGDHWFERNRDGAAQQHHHDIDIITRTLIQRKSKINSILEIGCGNGHKLDKLCQTFGAQGCGIEPSEKAVEDGSRRYPNLSLTVATASELPYPDNVFDLVYFGFSLYLVDRPDLYRAIANADRVLKHGGFIAILDFDPNYRHKRAYHHCSGIYSYKSNYPELFTASGHYHLVCKESYSHNHEYFDTDENERIALSLLFKEQDPYPLNQ